MGIHYLLAYIVCSVYRLKCIYSIGLMKKLCNYDIYRSDRYHAHTHKYATNKYTKYEPVPRQQWLIWSNQGWINVCMHVEPWESMIVEILQLDLSVCFSATSLNIESHLMQTDQSLLPINITSQYLIEPSYTSISTLLPQRVPGCKCAGQIGIGLEDDFGRQLLCLGDWTRATRFDTRSDVSILLDIWLTIWGILSTIFTLPFI